VWRFNFLGFPVTVEPWFWLTAFLLGGGLGIGDGSGLALTAVWMVVVFVSIMIHELGHAIASRKFGAHSEIRLIAFGGVTQMHGAYFDRFQSIIVSAAGPAFGFALGAVSTVVFMLIPVENPFLWYALRSLMFVNIFWTVINLLPILPMDGGQILRALLGPGKHQMACIIGAVCAALVALWALNAGQIFLAVVMGFFAYANFVNQNMPGGVTRD
jgi:Zn-dependent protease